jgi:hypothetical protein
MLAIKIFIDKVSYLDGRGGSIDYRMTITEARLLRDDLAKLLADYYALSNNSKEHTEELIKVEIMGGKF